jgi:antitoxin component YwqK of YwqJK toxin-antitoxin module
MKYLVHLIILAFSLISCSSDLTFEQQNHITETFSDIHISDELNLYVDKKGNLYNGKYTSSFDDGTPQADLLFENGMIVSGSIRGRDGICQVVYSAENGRVTETMLMPGGQPKLESVYENSVNNPVVFNVWYDDGTPFVRNDRSMAKMWHENGQIASAAPMIDGRMHGKVTGWHEDGTLAFENHFKDDKLHGTMKEWDKEGTLVRKRIYEMGTLISEEL